MKITQQRYFEHYAEKLNQKTKLVAIKTQNWVNCIYYFGALEVRDQFFPNLAVVQTKPWDFSMVPSFSLSCFWKSSFLIFHFCTKLTVFSENIFDQPALSTPLPPPPHTHTHIWIFQFWKTNFTFLKWTVQLMWANLFFIPKIVTLSVQPQWHVRQV